MKSYEKKPSKEKGFSKKSDSIEKAFNKMSKKNKKGDKKKK